MMLRTLIVFIAAALLSAAPGTLAGARERGASAREDGADLILRNGRFYVSPEAAPKTGSLVVRSGRIVFLGSSQGAEKYAGPSSLNIDLRGRTVTAGLIDSHFHLAGFGDSLTWLRLNGLGSYDAIIRRVVAAAGERPAGKWVLGRGWDQSLWGGDELPNNRALSAATPDHPVLLTRVDGHAALLNERALEALGISDSTPNPRGGLYVRGDRGHLTGLLLDEAYAAALSGLPKPDRAEIARRLRLAASRAASMGLTTVTDMGVSEGREEMTYEVMKTLAESDQLPVRVAVFLHMPASERATWMRRGPYVDPRFRIMIRGIKLFADGAMGSRGAALIEPYSDDPGNRGLLRLTPDEIESVCRKAIDDGFQLAVHAIGDRANRVVLDAYQRCFQGRPRPDLRFRIEHFQEAQLQDIQRLARLGVIASMQPVHATSDMRWAKERLGTRRLEGAYAWRRVLDAGGMLVLGSDAPSDNPDPRVGIYAAITRQDLNGNPAGGWLPGQRLTRPEALAGYTLNGARGLFLEDQIGSLEVGKLADLVVWGRDIMAIPPREIPTDPVDLTIVGGHIVYERGRG